MEEELKTLRRENEEQKKTILALRKANEEVKLKFRQAFDELFAQQKKDEQKISDLESQVKALEQRLRNRSVSDVDDVLDKLCADSTDPSLSSLSKSSVSSDDDDESEDDAYILSGDILGLAPKQITTKRRRDSLRGSRFKKSKKKSPKHEGRQLLEVKRERSLDQLHNLIHKKKSPTYTRKVVKTLKKSRTSSLRRGSTPKPMVPIRKISISNTQSGKIILVSEEAPRRGRSSLADAEKSLCNLTPRPKGSWGLLATCTKAPASPTACFVSASVDQRFADVTVSVSYLVDQKLLYDDEYSFFFPCPENLVMRSLEVQKKSKEDEVIEYLTCSVMSKEQKRRSVYLSVEDEDSEDGLTEVTEANVFIVSIGKVVEANSVLINLSYIQELPTDQDGYRIFEFWSGVVSTAKLTFSATVACSDAKLVKCPSHNAKITPKGKDKVEVKYESKDGIGENVVLKCKNWEVRDPEVWAEYDTLGEHPSTAVAVTFVPDVVVVSDPFATEIILLVDRTDNKDGEQFQMEKQLVLKILDFLYEMNKKQGKKYAIYLNICGFGDSCFLLFSEGSKRLNKETYEMLKEKVRTMEANLGSNELVASLQHVLDLEPLVIPNTKVFRQVFLIGSGTRRKDWNAAIRLCQVNSGKCRCFCFGVLKETEEDFQYFLEKLAMVSSGQHLSFFVNQGIDDALVRDVVAQSLKIGYYDVNINWECPWATVQHVPESNQLLLHGGRESSVYGLVTHLPQTESNSCCPDIQLTISATDFTERRKPKERERDALIVHK